VEFGSNSARNLNTYTDIFSTLPAVPLNCVVVRIDEDPSAKKQAKDDSIKTETLMRFGFQP